jgi:hypothetical protein
VVAVTILIWVDITVVTAVWDIITAVAVLALCLSEPVTGDVVLKAAPTTTSRRTSTVFAVALHVQVLLLSLTHLSHRLWARRLTSEWDLAQWLAPLDLLRMEAPMLSAQERLLVSKWVVRRQVNTPYHRAWAVRTADFLQWVA